ncbi:hypothetical protein D3X68_13790, partial [Acinetobacter baumannii]
MSIFCPSQTDSTCQNDAAIDLLGKIFGDGFIQAFVLGKSAAATAPATGELTPVLFGALGHLALVFAAFLFLFLVFTSVLHTARDGEVFGAGKKKHWVILRILMSGVMILPTTSLYSVSSVVLMMVVLASNGETNKAYREFLNTVVMNPSPSFASVDGLDPYGFRAYAIQKLRQYTCVRVLNQNFAAEGVSVGEKKYSDGQTYYVSNIGGERQFNSSLVDRNNVLDQGYFGAICGTSSYIVANADSVDSNFKYLTSENPDLESYKDFKKRLLLNIQNLKFQGIVRLNEAVLAYVNRLPSEAISPEEYARNFNQAFNNEEFDKIITDEIRRTDASINSHLQSNQNSYINKTIQYFAERGWTQVALTKKKLGEFQRDIYEARAKTIYEGTNPDLQRLNREGVASEKERMIYNVLVTQMDSTVNNYLKTPQVVTTLSTNDIQNLIPEDITNSDVSFKQISKDVEAANTTLVSNTMRIFIETFTGTGQDDGVDAVTRMQNTGNVLHIALTAVDTTLTGVRTGLSAAGATGAVFSDNIGTAAEIVIGLVDYYSEKLGKIMVMGKLVAYYLAVIIPTLPFVFFFFAVIGWIIHILQTMVGLILWSVMHMIPEQSFVGSQTQGYLTVVALFFRPMLSLVGFFLAFIISDPLLTFTTDGFFAIMGAVQFTNNGFIAALAQFFWLMGWVILYCLILLPIIYLIFGLPSSLADSVLAWLGTNLSRSLGETNLGQNVGRAANPAAGYYNTSGGGRGGSGGGSGGNGGGGSPAGGGGAGTRGDGSVLMNKGQPNEQSSGAQTHLPNATPSSSNSNWQSAAAAGAREGGIGGAIASSVSFAGRRGLQNEASAGTSVLSDVNAGANQTGYIPTEYRIV